jgi:hypothetical protein
MTLKNDLPPFNKLLVDRKLAPVEMSAERR